MPGESGVSSAVRQFATALDALRAAAGMTARKIAAQVRSGGSRPFVRSSLDEWFRGESVPSDRRLFASLVDALEGLARSRDRNHRSRGTADWERLRLAAEKERRAGQGGAPRRPRPQTPQAVGPLRGQPVARLRPEDAPEWEVHRPVNVSATVSGVLPLYVRRSHDRELRSVVEQAANGTSAMVVLVGDSSTGKTRACWEAVAELPGEWRVWHPLDPAPCNALADALEGGIAPRTVIWLNELQRYVGEQAGDYAERVAAGLRRLLQSGTQKGPVLVMGTVWPEYWDSLTQRPDPGETDAYPQARELLEGKAVYVPAVFDTAALEDVRSVCGHDPRLAEALERAADGRITQYVAGAPALLDRYRAAPPSVCAVIHAAMDIRRLGEATQVRREFLAAAAPGYLGDDVYDALPEGWLEKALAYTRKSCKGVRGLLSPVRPRPGASAGAGFKLADYLEHVGRLERRFCAPPASFWQAAYDHLSEPQVLRVLGRAAEARWRDGEAVALYQKALDLGDLRAARHLSWLWQEHGRQGEVARVEEQAALAGDGDALEERLQALLEQDRNREAECLLREAAYQGNPTAQLILARTLAKDGETNEADHWYAQVAECGDPEVLRAYAHDLRTRDDLDGARVALRAAGDKRALGELAALEASCGDTVAAETSACEAFAVNDVSMLKNLAEQAEVDGRTADAARLYRYAVEAFEHRRRYRAADVGVIDFEAGPRRLIDFVNPSILPMPPGETWALRQLVTLLDRTDGVQAGDDTLRRIADAGNPWALERLLRRLRETGRKHEAEALLQEEVSRASPWALWVVAHRSLHRSGDSADASQTPLERAATARVGQAIRILMERAEQAGHADEADRWALHAAVRGFSKPLREVIQQRERDGHVDAAERLAWQAPVRDRSSILQRLARNRTGDQVLPLLRRANQENLAWAPGLLAAHLEEDGHFAEAERFARQAADAGDRQPLADLAARRIGNDPDRRWRMLLTNGQTANGRSSLPWTTILDPRGWIPETLEPSPNADVPQ